MSSSKAFRTAGLGALCLLIGVVFSGALGGAQQPLPPQIIAPGDPEFKSLTDQLLGRNPVNRLPSVGVADAPEMLDAVKVCGTTIAEIFIDRDPALTAARSYDDGPLWIGAARSLDDGWLLDKAPLPKGDYFIWMADMRKLGIVNRIPITWFTAVTTVSSADQKVDIKDIAAILYYPDDKFRPPEEWLRAIGSIISLPKDRGCDLTVRHLFVTYRQITPPCKVPPCPPSQWEITAIAIVANIGQIDVGEPFTVRVLLNGRYLHEQELEGLAAGAQQMIVATAIVDRPGLYIVTVIVDPPNKIKERNERNNIAQRSIMVR